MRGRRRRGEGKEGGEVRGRRRRGEEKEGGEARGKKEERRGERRRRGEGKGGGEVGKISGNVSWLAINSTGTYQLYNC